MLPSSAGMRVPCSRPVTNIHSGPRVRGSSPATRKSTHPPDCHGSHWSPVNTVPGSWRTKFNPPCRFKSDRGAAKSDLDAVLAQTVSSTGRLPVTLFRKESPLTCLSAAASVHAAGLMFRSFVTSFFRRYHHHGRQLSSREGCANNCVCNCCRLRCAVRGCRGSATFEPSKAREMAGRQ